MTTIPLGHRLSAISPLDLIRFGAYMADGFAAVDRTRHVLDTVDEKHDVTINHSEVIDRMAEFADLVYPFRQRHDMPGVWEYEVVVDFGMWFANCLADTGRWPSREEAEEVARGLREAFINHWNN